MSDQRNPHALALVLAQVAKPKSSVATVARQIDYSRPALSRYIHNDLPNPRLIEAAILDRLDRRQCPHAGEEIEAEECRKKALAPRPFGGTARLTWWMACQSCPHKPIQAEKEESHAA